MRFASAGVTVRVCENNSIFVSGIILVLQVSSLKVAVNISEHRKEIYKLQPLFLTYS